MVALHVTGPQVLSATGLRVEELSGEISEDCPVTLGQLGRLAELLHTLPLDLLAQDCGTDADPLGDNLLIEFALAAEPRRLPELAEFLGWSTTRLAERINECWLWSTVTGRTHTPVCFGSWWRIEVRAETAEDASAAVRDHWLAERTAPDPFDAIAVLRIARADAPTDSAEQQRLAGRDLIASPRDGGAAHGLDRLHPDLRFALDLDAPPAPPPSSPAEPLSTRRPTCDAEGR